jgi:3-hydroxybutyryl-CoA dehydrogenase
MAARTGLATATEIRQVAVVGAGTMGHGIAQMAAVAGIEVVLCDVVAAAVAAGLDRIRANLDKGVARGKVDPDLRDRALGRIRGAADLAEAVAEADAVIEAAPEVMDLKQSIFRAVEAAAPAHALLATNTSSLSIGEVASVLARPERLVGMHFFNPVHLMKLLEVVHHAGNDADSVACARQLGERMQKTVIVVRDAPGFASSRLGIALGLEAMRMVEQGVASAADIDTAMKLGYGHPMGPLELTDHVGLDVRLHIADTLAERLGGAFLAPAILRDKVAAGKLGKKTGEGFYVWKDGHGTK